MRDFRPKLTFSVELPGGQDRLRQMILYVSQKCQDAKRFGGIKLNKIIWRADFQSFAQRRRPITGRAYQRLRFGPAAKEMLPLHREMIEKGLVEVRLVEFGGDIIEHRTIPLKAPRLDYFDSDDLSFADESIIYHWFLTGNEADDDCYGVAWRTRRDGDPMPYDSTYLSDQKIGRAQRAMMEKVIYDRGWMSE